MGNSGSRPPRGEGSRGGDPRAAVIDAFSATEEEKAHLQLLQRVAPGHPEAQFWVPSKNAINLNLTSRRVSTEVAAVSEDLSFLCITQAASESWGIPEPKPSPTSCSCKGWSGNPLFKTSFSSYSAEEQKKTHRQPPPSLELLEFASCHGRIVPTWVKATSLALPARSPSKTHETSSTGLKGEG